MDALAQRNAFFLGLLLIGGAGGVSFAQRAQVEGENVGLGRVFEDIRVEVDGFDPGLEF